jgi:hypothetical protein
MGPQTVPILQLLSVLPHRRTYVQLENDVVPCWKVLPSLVKNQEIAWAGLNSACCPEEDTETENYEHCLFAHHLALASY